MLTLYYAPRTRAVRIRWLLEELGLPHELRRVPFVAPAKTFTQPTPLGKLPAIEDDGVVIGESGAILEYILERYAEGRLAPPIGSPQRGEFLQWVHFAEGTAYPPLGIIIWHTLYKKDAESVPGVIAAARERAASALDVVERALAGKDYLLGAAFSAADIMMAFTLAVARVFGVLDERYPGLGHYMARLEARPAYQKAVAD
jgi:glutathione S-transferase